MNFDGRIPPKHSSATAAFQHLQALVRRLLQQQDFSQHIGWRYCRERPAMTDGDLPGHFRLLYFSTAAKFTGKDSDTFPAPMPIHKLFSSVESRYPGITAQVLKSCAVTVNLEYVDMQAMGAKSEESAIIIGDGDELALIPPVSAG